MNHSKKIIALATAVMAIAVTSVTAFAASAYKTPAEIVAGLTNRTVESVTAERTETKSTYGSIASKAGVLDEFKTEILKLKKEQLAEKVKAGTMTQEKSDAVIKALETNQATCDGSGSARIGRQNGAGFGAGQGRNAGAGCGQGRGTGNGLRDGSCFVQ